MEGYGSYVVALLANGKETDGRIKETPSAVLSMAAAG
jgi:hypothetical protein